MRNIKLTFWTTRDVRRLNSDDHIVAECVFALVPTKLMFRNIKNNLKKGNLTKRQAENLTQLAAYWTKENERNRIHQETATLAYLVIKGKNSGVSGSQIVGDQLATLEWRKTEDGKVFLPVITLWDEKGDIEIECGMDVREKNKFNRRAAEFIGYHDPLDYNAYRKEKKS
jgi:hypothetical protein